MNIDTLLDNLIEVNTETLKTELTLLKSQKKEFFNTNTRHAVVIEPNNPDFVQLILDTYFGHGAGHILIRDIW